MKTFNNMFIRPQSLLSKKVILLGLLAALSAGCGSDNKSDKGNVVSTTPIGTSPVFTGSDANSGIWNSLKAQVQCPQGRMQDLTFTIQGYSSYQNPYYGGYQSSYYYGGSSSNISGNLTQGTAGGSFQGGFFGKSAQGDLLYVSRVTDGTTASYNIVVSFCIYQDYHTQYIGPQANMSNFYAQNISLSNSTSCATGSVLDGYIGFWSPTFGGNVPIRFASANIGNCY